MFTLKIFLLGLIAVVPSADQQELTVLMVDGRQGYTAADGTEIGPHYGFLLARAGTCQGDCERGDTEIATFFFPEKGTAARDLLGGALQGGAVWRLSESDVSLASPSQQVAGPLTLSRTRAAAPRGVTPPLPATPLEASDFGWIADLSQVHSAAGPLDDDHLASRPIKGWVLARLRLHHGRVSAFRLAGIENQVVPIGFRPLQGGTTSHFAQALADAAIVEIELDAAAIEIVEEGFGGGNRRWMRLAPNTEGVVEMALVNMPPAREGHRHNSTPSGLPAPGRHFEMFYALTQNEVPKAERRVPHADTRVGVLESKLYPRRGEESPLLFALGLDSPRTVLEAELCPIVYIPPPGG